ncbi:MBL fold metallo-hydrolase [bacterium]|nr:MBL fold metallo-hydrolase [bacterium]
MIIKTFIEGPISANNYLLIDNDEAVLIDCSSPREEFVNAVKSQGVKLKYIFLTHGHFDHILGCDKFKETFSCEIHMNEKDRMQVQQAPQMLSYYSGAVIESINSITKDVFDGDEFVFGNVKIKAISTPGHTQGGMCYLIDGKLFSGDTLFRESVGRCDLPGGNWKELLSSVRDKLFKLPDETIVYTGHGPSTTIGYEKKYNEILNI